MAITREDFCKAVKEVYESTEKFLDDIENDCIYRFDIFKNIDETLYNGDVLILDHETNKFVSWYKFTHLGRDLHTNIETEKEIKEFIQAFKAANDKEREEE